MGWKVPNFVNTKRFKYLLKWRRSKVHTFCSNMKMWTYYKAAKRENFEFNYWKIRIYKVIFSITVIACRNYSNVKMFVSQCLIVRFWNSLMFFLWIVSEYAMCVRKNCYGGKESLNLPLDKITNSSFRLIFTVSFIYKIFPWGSTNIGCMVFNLFNVVKHVYS